MIINFKKLDKNAKLPRYAKPGDAGLDLVTTAEPSIEFTGSDLSLVYKTGIAVEIPEGYVGLIYPRSSIRNYILTLSNSVGVIDSGYRGEIMVSFKLLNSYADFNSNVLEDLFTSEVKEDEASPLIYHKGDKIAQMIIVPYPMIIPKFVDTLSSTERGGKGHGSSGK